MEDNANGNPYTGPGDVDLDFGGRNITVTSQNGPATTIIDCGGSSVKHRGFHLHSGETNAVISGFTIQNGYETNNSGGGIFNDNVGVTVQNCILKNNTATEAGGGICNFTEGSYPITVTNCIFTGNTTNYGGGLYNENDGSSTITVTNCLFAGNAAIGLADNTGYYPGLGGGLFNGIYPNNSGGSISVTNCTLTGNTARGINDNNGNYLPGLGGGLYSDDEASGTVTATSDILYGDTSDSGGEIANDPASTSSAIANYCDIQGGYAGTGNINADPQFVNSPIDLHLKVNSPCALAGTSSGAPATDLDGVARPDPPSIGAYEGITVANNVSGQVTVTRGGFVRTPRTTAFTQTVTLTNTSGTSITGPISLVLDGLTSGVTLTNQSGVTVNAAPGGSPYLSNGASLAAGASVTLTLRFNDPALVAIGYQTRILAGSGSR